ncbi:MAG: polysaccharide deacetylase family protein [Clostridia bacterium]
MIYRIKSNVIAVIVVAFLTLIISFFTFEAKDTMSNKIEEGIRVPIIMYHSILNEPKRAGKYVVSENQLEKDIIFLKDNGYSAITVSDLIEYKENDEYILPLKPIIITFDDGYYNNYVYAYPLMKKYNFKCVISVVGEYSAKNKPDEILRANYSHLTFEQIKEMNESGYVEIANHSFNMHTNSKTRNGSGKNKNESIEKYSEIFIDDTTKLQNMLFEQSSLSPTCYTFPFGKMCEEANPLLKEMGFKATLSCYEKINYITKDSDLFGLFRFNRPSGKSSEQYFNKILS